MLIVAADLITKIFVAARFARERWLEPATRPPAGARRKNAEDSHESLLQLLSEEMRLPGALDTWVAWRALPPREHMVCAHRVSPQVIEVGGRLACRTKERSQGYCVIGPGVLRRPR